MRAERSESIQSKLFQTFDEITSRTPAERCLIASATVLPALLGYLFVMVAGWIEPSAAPYLNQEILPMAVLIQGFGFGGVWLCLLLWSLWATRRTPHSKLLVYATCQATGLWAIGSYFFGHFTFPFGMSLMAFMAMLAVLFETRPVILGNVTFYTIFFSTIVLEQLRLIPYAPLIGDSPVDDFQLQHLWIFGIGGMVVISLFFFLPLLFFACARAREREEAMTRASAVMSRYVPSQLARKMLAGETVLVENHERRRLTIFFSDVAGFTKMADELEPEETSRILNEYIGAMAVIAEKHAASLNEIIGDGLMVLFGAPMATNDKDHAVRALNMALDMQDRVAELRERWKSYALEDSVAVRMGINTGYATVGNFGSEGRVTYTAIGTQTNIAARIEELCEPGEVWVSHTTWKLSQDTFEFEDKGEVKLKGIRKPIRLYRVIGPKGTVEAEPRLVRFKDKSKSA